jgi:hypothetical protein
LSQVRAPAIFNPGSLKGWEIGTFQGACDPDFPIGGMMLA